MIQVCRRKKSCGNRGELGHLKRGNAVDVNQRAMHRPISFGVNDDDAVFAERYVFGVTDLMDFAVRQAQLEWLKRSAVQPFANRFHVHTANSTTGDSE
ncbi:MAG: hypothetical protein ACREHD_24950 [Pirellulales bacterium]